MAQMYTVDVAGIRNAQQKIRKPRMVGHELHILVGFHNGFQLRSTKDMLDARDCPKKRVHRPGKDKLRPRALCAEVVFEPAFLIVVNTCCDLRHDAPDVACGLAQVRQASCYAMFSFCATLPAREFQDKI